MQFISLARGLLLKTLLMAITIIANFMSYADSSKVTGLPQIIEQERRLWQCKKTDNVCEFPVYYEVCVQKKSNGECSVRERVEKQNLGTELPGEPKYKVDANTFEKQYFQAFPHYFPLPAVSATPTGDENVRSRIGTSLRTHPPVLNPNRSQDPQNESISNNSRNINLYTFRCSNERNLTALLRKQSLVFQSEVVIPQSKQKIALFKQHLNDPSRGPKSTVYTGYETVLRFFESYARPVLDEKIGTFGDWYDNKRIKIPATTHVSRDGVPTKIDFGDAPLVDDNLGSLEGVWNRFVVKPNWTNIISGERRATVDEYKDIIESYQMMQTFVEEFGFDAITDHVKIIDSSLQQQINAKRKAIGITASLGVGGDRFINHILASHLRLSQIPTFSNLQAARQGDTPTNDIFKNKPATQKEIYDGMSHLFEYVLHHQRGVPKKLHNQRVVNVFRINNVTFTSGHISTLKALASSGKTISQRIDELNGQNWFFLGSKEVKEELGHLHHLRLASFKANQYFAAKVAAPLYLASAYWNMFNWLKSGEASAHLTDLEKNIPRIISEEKFKDAERDCTEKLNEGRFPLPIGAIFGALRKSTSDKNLGFYPDVVVTDRDGVERKLIEIELVYMPIWSKPVDFSTIEGDGVGANVRRPGDAKWKLEQEETIIYKALSPTLKTDSSLFIESLFKESGFSGSPSGERAITEVQRRYFVDINDLLTLNDQPETTQEKLAPSQRQVHKISNYWEFLRGTGGTGFLIKPDFYKALNASEKNPGRHIVEINANHTRKLVDLGLGRVNPEDVDFIPKKIAQLSRRNIYSDLARSLQTLYPTDFSGPKGEGLQLLNRIMAHTFYVPVDVMVKSAQIRKQPEPSEQCFQYVKDAAIIGKVVDLRPLGHANNGAAAFGDVAWEDGQSNFSGVNAFAENSFDNLINPNFLDAQSEDATQNTGLGGERLVDIYKTGSLSFLCRKIVQSVTDVTSNPPKDIADRICSGRNYPGDNVSRRRSMEEIDRRYLAENAHLSAIKIPNIQTWLTKNPFLECLAPYASIVFYSGGKYGHAEIKTEEMGLCGFVSDFYDTFPISQSLRSQGSQNNLKDQRQVQEIQIVRIPGM